MPKQEKHPEKSAEEKPRVGKGKRGRKRKGMCLGDRPVLEPNAAGIDTGAREIFVAVPSGRGENPVRVFLPFTEDLQEMAKWLVSRGIATVTMESTGVYWIPPHNVLEQYGVKPCLLEGNWRPEHLFTLKQSRRSYQHCQEQIAACDEKIEKLLAAFQPRVDPAEQPLPPGRKRKQRGRKKKNVNPKPGFDVRTESYKLFGVDLTQVPGLMAMVLTLFSEVGRDMSRWPTAAHFVSWLALCPDNDVSGGRVLWRGVRKVHDRAGRLFRLTAQSPHHEQTPMGTISAG